MPLARRYRYCELATLVPTFVADLRAQRLLHRKTKRDNHLENYGAGEGNRTQCSNPLSEGEPALRQFSGSSRVDTVKPKDSSESPEAPGSRGTACDALQVAGGSEGAKPRSGLCIRCPLASKKTDRCVEMRTPVKNGSATPRPHCNKWTARVSLCSREPPGQGSGSLSELQGAHRAHKVHLMRLPHGRAPS